MHTEAAKTVYGYIHSVESFGAVDGPGVRFVVFMQGCPLRCLYCHNPDTRRLDTGNRVTAQELFTQILEYKSFIKSGGVTFSGGEPLVQAEFLTEVIKLCRGEGIHTAVDTSGGVPLAAAKTAIAAADLLLLDIKDIDTEGCITLTGKSNTDAFDILNYCEYIEKPVWIRHVVVPKYTMKEEKYHRMGRILSWYHCIERLELIPFHKMGEYKWEFEDTAYMLHEIGSPADEDMLKAKEIMKSYGLPL